MGMSKPFKTILCAGLLFALLHGFAEIVHTDRGPFVVGESVRDWLEIAAAFGIYAGGFCGLLVLCWAVVHLRVGPPSVKWAGAIVVACLTSGAALTVLESYLLETTVYGMLILLGLVGSIGIVLFAFERVGMISARVLCIVWSLAAASAVIALSGLSELFFLRPERAQLAGALAMSWGGLVGVFGTILAIVCRRYCVPTLFQLLLVALLGCLLPAEVALRHKTANWLESTPGPQMVFIICDALRADYCSVYGGHVPTPNLEALAERGVVFDQCYALAPWTLPSVCGMFASKYPMGTSRDGAMNQWGEVASPGPHLTAYWLDEDGCSAVERMGDNRTVTVALIANPGLVHQDWLLRGFTHVKFFNYLYADPRCLFWRFPALHRLVARYFPSIRRQRPLDTTERIVRDAVHLIRQHRKTSFFLWLHLMDPHDPYNPPSQYRKICGAEEIFPPADVKLRLLNGIQARTGAITEEHRRHAKDLYEGEISYVDEAVGRVWEELTAQTRGEGYLCVTADHGEELWDHGRWGHGQSLHQELVRVPLIFSGPKLVCARISDAVSAIDLMPTLASLMGTNPMGAWRGRSLTHYLFDWGEHEDPTPCFIQGTLSTPFGSEPLRAVVKDGWKFVQGLSSGRIQLYDLNHDPKERENLAETQAEQARALQLLAEEWAQTFPSDITAFAEQEVDEDKRREALDALRALGYL